MSRTAKHQQTYDSLHKGVISYKIARYFNRINFWDWDLRIAYRRHKDFVRGGGKTRIKQRNYH